MEDFLKQKDNLFCAIVTRKGDLLKALKQSLTLGWNCVLSKPRK